jgi:hypothetical protein
MSICYAFRCLDTKGEQMGYVGFAYAKNMLELFWEIDQFYDPYLVEIKELKSSSMCMKIIDINEFDNYELGERFTSIIDKQGFKKPEWPENVYG